MALVVQKYGGTSVRDADRIRAVARRVAAAHLRGDRLVVVVSAMGHTTDELLALAAEVTLDGRPAASHPRETDMLLTAGERISMAVLAMAIRDQGPTAISLTGSQAAIITDEAHTAARVVKIRADRVRRALDEDKIVILAGFQGISRENEITTLGRGGSDTTAVAMAAALEADRCEIYTDVDGVYTADPRRVPGARIIPVLSHEEMLEMASSGAQVMHARAVDIGARFGVDIRVLSSFRDDDPEGLDPRGTLITRAPTRMEELVVTGIAPSRGHAKLVLRGLPAGTATAAGLLSALAEAGVSVDMFSESAQDDGGVQLQATVAEDALDEARRVAAAAAERLGGGTVEAHDGLSRITLVGSGMTGRPGVYARAYRALVPHAIEVHGVSTSSISITVLVPSEREDDALQALHDAFGLGAAPRTAMGAG